MAAARTPVPGSGRTRRSRCQRRPQNVVERRRKRLERSEKRPDSWLECSRRVGRRGATHRVPLPGGVTASLLQRVSCRVGSEQRFTDEWSTRRSTLRLVCAFPSLAGLGVVTPSIADQVVTPVAKTRIAGEVSSRAGDAPPAAVVGALRAFCAVLADRDNSRDWVPVLPDGSSSAGGIDRLDGASSQPPSSMAVRALGSGPSELMPSPRAAQWAAAVPLGRQVHDLGAATTKRQIGRRSSGQDDAHLRQQRRSREAIVSPSS